MKRLRRDDRGQITTALVMVGTVMVVALALTATKVGQATDQKSQVQTAADAAALAGAQQIARDAPGLALEALVPAVGHQSGRFDRLIGRASASDFAARAGAQMVSYSYDLGTDTVRVTVQSLGNSVSGSPAKATAEARVGVALEECEPLSPPNQAPTPPSTPATGPPSPSETATVSPPAAVELTVRCGAVTFPVVVDGAGGRRIDLSEAEVRDLFTPALKS